MPMQPPVRTGSASCHPAWDPCSSQQMIAAELCQEIQTQESTISDVCWTSGSPTAWPGCCAFEWLSELARLDIGNCIIECQKEAITARTDQNQEVEHPIVALDYHQVVSSHACHMTCWLIGTLPAQICVGAMTVQGMTGDFDWLYHVMGQPGKAAASEALDIMIIHYSTHVILYGLDE